MDNLLINNFKKEKSAKCFLENNNIYKKSKHNQLIECMIKNDPLFDLINQHKKRLQEIKEWQMSITGDGLQSEFTMIDATDKNNKSKKDLNNNNIEQPHTRIEESKIDNNIKLAKDFLKFNSINKNQSSIAIDNTCTINNNDNNDDSSSININISNTNYNNIINENNNNNITNNINTGNMRNQNENDNNLENNNTNDNSFSALKDSLRNNLDVNANNDNNNNNGFVNFLERKFMKTGINFNKKLALDNLKNIDINNYKTNNNTNNKKHRHFSSRLTNYNVTSCTNNEIVNSLEFKLEKKRVKIKNLEATIDLLTKENNNLKIYINELETKIENFHLINNNKKNLFTKEMLDKINSLTKEIKEKNEIIEKMKISEKIKNQELQALTQRCRELVSISNENKTYSHKKEQIMFTINYFIKKIYNMIPVLSNNESLQDIKEPSELQKHLIIIEHFINEFIIYNSNKKSSFLIDFENKNKNNQYLIDLKKEREREELEKKESEFNEQKIFLLKEMSNNKKVKKKKSNNSSKTKKGINKVNNKNRK